MEIGERLAVLETKLDAQSDNIALLMKWIGDGDSGLVKRVSTLERFQAWAEKLLAWVVAPVGALGVALGALAKPLSDKIGSGS